MTTRGGKRPGAGRKPNTPNKATQKRQEEVAASGLTPLDYMLSVLRNDLEPPEMRFEAAKAAAPYVHPKLSSIESSGKDGGPIKTVTTIELVAGDKDDEGTN
jgi:hypothetical protein